MTARRSTKKIFRNSGMMLTSTKFDTAGEFVTSTMNITTSTLTKSVYIRRHIVSLGHVTVSFPGTDEPSVLGPLGASFPYEKEEYKISDNSFRVTADEPGSQYYCVIPLFAGDNTWQVNTELVPGGEHVVNTGTIAFVYGNDFTVNSTQVSSANSATVLACEFGNAHIVATEPTKIVEFGIVRPLG